MPVQHPNNWKRGTQQDFIAQHLLAAGASIGIDLRQPHPEIRYGGQDFRQLQAVAFFGTDVDRKAEPQDAGSIRFKVGTGVLVFKSNAGIPYPIGTAAERGVTNQRQKAYYRTAEILKSLLTYGYDGDVDCGGCDNGEHCGACVCCPAATPEPEPTPEPTPEPVQPPSDLARDLERFWREAERLREFVAARANFDPFHSMRIEQDGARAIVNGAPVEAVLYSLTMTWQADSRQQAGIGEYDFGRFAPAPDFCHAVAPYVEILVKANVPVWLGGPAGTGKSSAAKLAADRLGLDYYEINLAGAMRSAVTGRDRLKEFIESDFMRAYRDGGLICIEEIDMAHPTVIGAINNAIAGDHFANDATGELVKRHPNFRIVATANTWGTGATKEFNGRNKLDGATLDRFRAGRVLVNRDNRLARQIFDSIIADAIA